MEISIINRISEFEATHSLISRIFPNRFWKWGALLLALLFTISGMSYRIKFFILHYHTKSKSLLSATQPLLPNFDEDLSTDDDDDDENDDVSSDDDEKEQGDDPCFSTEDLTRFDDDFRVKGKFKIRRRRSIGDDFSLMDLVGGNGVVKLWDGSFLGDLSPAVIFSSGAGDDEGLGLGLWDFRTSLRKPAVQAEWRSDRRASAVGVDRGRTGKVFVRDERDRVEIRDVRKFDTPLEKSTADEMDTCWDADGTTESTTR